MPNRIIEVIKKNGGPNTLSIKKKLKWSFKNKKISNKIFYFFKYKKFLVFQFMYILIKYILTMLLFL